MKKVFGKKKQAGNAQSLQPAAKASSDAPHVTAPHLTAQTLSDASLFYENETFFISFSASSGGHYRMPIPERKLQQAADKTTKVARDPLLKPVTAGETGKFIVPKAKPTENCPQGEKISVEVRTPSGELAESRVVDNGDGTATVHYHTSEAGSCKVFVSRSQTNEYSAPVTADVASPERSEFSGDELKACHASKKATFFVQAKDRFSNNATTGGLPFAATLTDSKGNVLTAEVVDNNNGTYAISFLPETPGETYTTEVTCGAQRIAGFETVVGAAPTAIHTTALAAAQPISRGEGFVDAITDAPVTFMVESKDMLIKQNNFSVTLTDTEGGKVDAKVLPSGDGKYAVTYRPPRRGRYSIHMSSGDVPIAWQSAAAAGATAKATPVIAIGQGQVTSAGAGILSTFDFHSNDPSLKSGKPLTAVLTPADGGAGGAAPVHGSVTKTGRNKYSVNYCAPTAGVYNIALLSGDKSISWVPAEERAASKETTSSIAVYGKGVVQGTSGIESKMLVSCSDKQLASNTDLDCILTAPDGTTTRGFVRPEGNNCYSISYCPPVSGVYSVSLTAGQSPVAWTPYSQQWVDAARASSIIPVYAPGEGVVECVGGTATSFVVSCFDEAVKADDVLEVTFTDDDGALVTGNAVPLGHGRYEVSCFTPSSGKYSVSLSNGATAIPWTPVLTTHNTDSAPIMLTGKGVLQATAGVVNEVKIAATDLASADGVECILTAPDGSTSTGQVTADGSGCYSISYTPASSGAYTVSLSAADAPVTWTPYSQQWVDAARGTSIVPVYAAGQGVVDCVGGAPTTFVVSCFDDAVSAGELFDVMFTDSQGEATRGAVVPLGNSRYQVSCIAPRSGQYSVSITAANSPISWTPVINPNMPVGSAAPLFVAGQALVTAQANTQFVTVIQTAQPVQGLQAVVTSSQKGGQSGQAVVRCIGDCVYAVSHTPTVDGEHTIAFSAAGAPVLWGPAIAPVMSNACEHGSQPVNVRSRGQGHVTGVAGQAVNVILLVNDAEVPNGDLRVVVKGNTGPVEAKVVSNGDGRWAVSFVPPTTGNYSIEMTAGDHPVRWSPLNCLSAVDLMSGLTSGLATAVAASGDAVVVAPQGDSTVVVYVHDEAAAAGRGFNAFLLSAGGDRLEAKLTQLEGYKYAVTFSAPSAGQYDIRMTYGEEAIAWTPAREEGSVHATPNGPALVEAAQGQATTFIVQSHDDAIKKGDVFFALLTSPKGQKVGAQVLPNGEGKYAVTFIPPVNGIYHGDLLVGDKHIQWMPVNIRAIAEAKAVSTNTEVVVAGEGAVQAVGGTLSSFTVYSLDPLIQNCDTFDVKMTATDGSQITGAVTKVRDGKFEITYTPPVSGRYGIHLSRNAEPITWSPFPLLASPPPSLPAPAAPAASPAKEAIAGTGAGGGRSAHSPSGRAGNARALRGKKAGGGSGGGVGGDSLPVQPQMTTAVLMQDTSAQEEGRTSRMSSTRGSFVDDEFVPRRRRSSVYKADSQDAKGTGLVEATAGTPSVFLITSTDEGLKDHALKAVLTGQDGSVVEGTVSRTEGNQFSITYTVPSSGAYAIALTAGDAPVIWRPVTVTSIHSGNASASKAENEKKKVDAVVGVPSTFLMQSHDAAGNPFRTGGITSFKAVLAGPSGKEVPCSVSDRLDGTYCITYIPVESGDNTLTVHMGSELCCGGPMPLLVMAGPPDGSTSTSSGEGLEYAYATKASTFDIITRDKFNNPCTIGGGPIECTIEHADTHDKIVPNIEDHNDGTYTVTYMPTLSGKHTISLTAGGVPFPSCWEVDCGEAPGGKNIMAINVATLEVAADETSSIFLQSHDHNGNNFKTGGISGFEVIVIGPSGQHGSGSVEDRQDGSYICSFTPVQSGKNKLHVRVGATEIPDSPFDVNVTKGYTHVPSCTADGDGIHNAFGNELCNVNIQARGENGNPRSEGGDKFKVVMKLTPKGQPAELKVNDLNNGKYTVAYKVRNPGTYQLDITCDDVHIKDSPFFVTIVPGSDVSEIEKIFKKYDLSGDGSISEEEFALLLDDLNVDLSFKQKLDMYNRANPDGHGGIDLPEFKAFWKTFYANLPRKKISKRRTSIAGVEWTDEDQRVTTEAFKKYDKDLDDVLNPFEFRRMLDDLGLLLRTQDILDLYHAINMQKCSLGITYDDFETWWIGFKDRPSVSSMEGDTSEVQWSDVLEISLRASFDKYDPNGDGTISFLEFGMLMEDLEIQTTTSALMGLYEMVDDNANGSITYDEFRNWWMVFQVTKGRYGL